MVTNYLIQYIDTDPDTGLDYQAVDICQCEHEWAATLVHSTLARELAENDFQNRIINTIKLQS
jgi:hypothetical protein